MRSQNILKINLKEKCTILIAQCRLKHVRLNKKPSLVACVIRHQALKYEFSYNLFKKNSMHCNSYDVLTQIISATGFE